MENKKIEPTLEEMMMVRDHIESLSKDDLLKMISIFLDKHGLEMPVMLTDKNDKIKNNKMEKVASLGLSKILEEILLNDPIASKYEFYETTLAILNEHMFAKGIIVIPEQENITILDLNCNENKKREIQFEDSKYNVTEGKHLFSYTSYYAGIFVPPQGVHTIFNPNMMYSVVFNDSKNNKFQLSNDLIAYQEAFHQHVYHNKQIFEGKTTAYEKKVIESTSDNQIMINRDEALGDWLTMKLATSTHNPINEYKWISFLTDESKRKGYKLSRDIVKESLKPLFPELELFLNLQQKVEKSDYTYNFTDDDIIFMHTISEKIANGYESFFESLDNKDLDKTIESINNQYFYPIKDINMVTDEEINSTVDIPVEYVDLKITDDIFER